MNETHVRFFLTFLALTLLIEIPTLFLVIRFFFRIPPNQLETKYLLIGGWTASCLTYPYLWFVVPAFIDDFSLALLVSESLIIAAESVVLLGILRISCFQAFGSSVMCNGTSIVLGLLFNFCLKYFKMIP
jgi:hypothetical protein